MVKFIVDRKLRELPAHAEAEDFISCGVVALIGSIDRYDPEKGATLEQYAWTCLHGAVLDELRRNDWAPRSLRRWDRDINKARDQFVSLYPRAPTPAELSESVGISLDELIQHREDINRNDVGSLNTLELNEDQTQIEMIDTLPSDDRHTDPDLAATRNDARERLLATLKRLPERDRKVAVLYHVHNLKRSEIGEILGVSDSRVSQLHTALTKTLREQLHSDEQLFAAVTP